MLLVLKTAIFLFCGKNQLFNFLYGKKEKKKKRKKTFSFFFKIIEGLPVIILMLLELHQYQAVLNQHKSPQAEPGCECSAVGDLEALQLVRPASVLVCASSNNSHT